MSGGAPVRARVPLAAALVALAAAAGGCGGSRLAVTSEADPAARFAAFRVCAWRGAPRVDCRLARREELLVQWRVRTAVEAGLRGLGYGVTDDGTGAECLVAADVTCRHRTTDTIGEYVAYRRAGGRQGLSEAFVIGYEAAELVVTVAAAATGATVWRGTATTVAEDGLDERAVTEAVGAILARFPPAGHGGVAGPAR